MNNRKGLLIVLSGPSGAGKGTLRSGILAAFPDMEFCISATTRPSREGEVHGSSYYFLTKEEFEQKMASDGFLELAEYVGNYYGTPREPVESCLNGGRHVLLEKEMQGARQLKEKFPEGVFIFVVPPSMEELSRRLAGRGTETPEEQSRRLVKAVSELNGLARHRYDYIVVNDRIDLAVERIKSIIIAEMCRASRQPDGWVEAILGKEDSRGK